jgi:hypothetical protein
MSNALIPSPSGAVLVLAENPMRPAIDTYHRVRSLGLWQTTHAPAYAPEAEAYRDKHLKYFCAAVDAAQCFKNAMTNRYVDEQAAAIIIAEMHRMMATKASERDGLVEGTVKVLMHNNAAAKFLSHHDETIYPTPRVIGLTAFRQLQMAKFPPKPMEFLDSCREVSKKIKSAHKCCEEWLTGFTAADAVLFAFAPDKWEQPYQLPCHRVALREVLYRHFDRAHEFNDKLYEGVLTERLHVVWDQFNLDED